MQEDNQRCTRAIRIERDRIGEEKKGAGESDLRAAFGLVTAAPLHGFMSSGASRAQLPSSDHARRELDVTKAAGSHDNLRQLARRVAIRRRRRARLRPPAAYAPARSRRARRCPSKTKAMSTTSDFVQRGRRRARGWRRGSWWCRRRRRSSRASPGTSPLWKRRGPSREHAGFCRMAGARTCGPSTTLAISRSGGCGRRRRRRGSGRGAS